MKKIVVPIILIVCLSAVQGQFLWQDDGIPLRQGFHIQWAAESAQNSLGETCIIWIDSRLGDSKIYAQKFDADGSPLWDEGGVMVGGFAFNCYAPPLINSTSDNGFIIVWGHVEYSGEGDIRAQKLSVDGEIQWAISGIDVCTAGGMGSYLKLISDETGDAYITWYDGRDQDYGIYMIRILPDGTLATGWNINGNAVHLGTINGGGNGQLLCRDGLGGVITTWAAGGDIYVQRMNSEGGTMWTPGGVTVSALPNVQDQPAICEDGYGGAYIVWQDNPYDYSIWMQRIDGNGNSVWTQGGEVLCQQAGSQNYPEIVYSNDNCAVIAWEDFRNNNTDIYCQKINESGDLLWATSGQALSLAFNAQIDLSIDTDNFGGMFASWLDKSGGLILGNIYAQYISFDGQLLWRDNGMAIADIMGSKLPTMNRTSDGGMLCAWYNYLDDNDGVYLQKVDAEGNIQLQPNGEPVFESLADDVDEFCLTAFSEDYFFAVWEDSREYLAGHKLYYQVFDLDGNPVLEENGLPLCDINFTAPQVEAQCTASSDGNAIVVWEDWRISNNDERIYAQKIDTQGNLLWNAEGVFVFDGCNPSICADDFGGAYIKFTASGGTYIHRMTEDGQFWWNDPVWFPGSSQVSGIVEDGTGGVIAAWYSPWPSEKDIYAARILPTGVLDWTRTVCGAVDDQNEVCVISSIETGAVISWTDQRVGYYMDIYAAKIDTTGNMPWGQDGIAVCDWESQQRWSRLMEDEDGYIWVSWTDQRGIGYDTYCQRLTANGDILFQEGGIYIAGGSYDQDDCVSVSDGSGGAIFVWRDESIDWWGNIQAIHLDDDGQIANPVWNPAGNAVCDYYGGQFIPAIVKDGFGGAVAVWLDTRSSTYVEENILHSDLYMQRINDYIVSVEIPDEATTSLSYHLCHPYPNPFNQRVALDFMLPAAADVSLTVYDITGREAASLLEGRFAPGEHQVVWDAEGVGSGVYFIKLSAVGSQQSVKKVVLVK